MYVDKPMRGHGLMQAIARVNRVFSDKPGGLVVDYLGLADELKQALATYTESGGTGETALDSGGGRRRDAGEVRDRLRPVPRLRLVEVDTGTAAENGSRCFPPAQEHILAQEDGKERFVQVVTSCPGLRAGGATTRRSRIRDEWLLPGRAGGAAKQRGEQKTPERLDHAIRQIVSRAVASEAR